MYNDKHISKKSASLQKAAQHNTSNARPLEDNRASVQKKQMPSAKEEEDIIQKKENNTGLPDQLKAGVEKLSGHSMDDVKVHYNSDEPAQLNAYAYAQGTEIHVAAGREKHLPHEAWHVVQQKEGRVKPTLQMRSKVNVNDDKALEHEADVMGAKAQQRQHSFIPQLSTFVPSGHLVQQKTVTQLARTKTTARKKGTISGHGNLRVDLKKNQLMKFIVPKGKTVMRPAPPGATLGDISMLLNTMKDPTRDKLLKQMMISTTPEIWSNKEVIKLIKKSKIIKKTDKQKQILKKLRGRTKYKDLTGGEKGSLASLEKKKEFESELTDYIEPHTFQTFDQGEEMEDMVLTAFEKKLRSGKKNDQNEYVENETFLSDYVNDNTEDDFVVNACSYHPNSPFTGFQIDQKK